MTVAPPRPTAPLDLTRAALPATRRWRNTVATGGMVAALALAAVPLALICYQVLLKGAGSISWEFLTEDIPNSARRAGGGIAPAIVGTLVITGTAALLAIPLGVLGAVYLNEYGKSGPLAKFIRTMADVMTGVPSIVMGLFIYVIMVIPLQQQSGLAGALALACLMLPVVIRSTEEVLRLVPDDLRQASAALGARRWYTIVTVVLPAAVSGITSGAMLAVARAAGETAPLIFTTGIVYQSNWSLSGANTALPALIFKNASEPFAAANGRAWGAAITLVVLVLAATVIARLISGRFAVKDR
ncbi:phosphate transport system permease protein PstA [Pilimelia terevasa]|uniref:Phosphate transport system permease protein PstA n=1 Tax=Pilimelia terevasa TaxID=53372 RepID=A0A8J3BRC3_9ACTN|nr:phosphate ABC transporter permease PstA [Pilimelia terevasa]GGK29601.1 phosphate transport system permease protein PstA [Pilimelia terevasa]